MADAAGAVAAGRHWPRHPLLRRGSGWIILLGVSLLHVLAADKLLSDRFGWGENDRSITRIEVAFVRELMQAKPPEAPPVVARAPAQRALPAVAERPAEPASAPAAAAPEPAEPPRPPEPEPAPPPADPPLVAVRPIEPAPPPAALAEEPSVPGTPTSDVQAMVISPPGMAPPLPVPGERPASAAAAEPVNASATPSPAFEWPPSTQLSYVLQGYYRGPVEGSALVEWVRSGQRYQVRMETSAGPLMRRSAVSDGELTARGLQPRRFDGEQRVGFRSRRWAQQFGPERITLADGSELVSMPGVQDEASQFVQLTWLFTTQPALLQPGRSIEVPLMLNRRLDRWVYDVKEPQTLRLSFGEVPTYHVKPRREARPGALTTEMWFAPSLQYLPVRILIRQDESTYMDLTLERPPLQAGGETATR